MGCKSLALMGIFALTLISLLVLLATPVKAGEISMSIKEGFLQQTYVNQPVNITAVPLSGTAPYTYQWYTQLWTSMGGSPIGPITPFPDATSATFRFVEDTAGTYDISMQINDSAGNGDYDSFPIQGVWVVVKSQPSPTPTLTLTPTPTGQPTVTSSTSTPTVPEVPLVTILTLILSAFSVALVLRHRKITK